jgi:multiple sugar transport system substrate-binding protein
MQHGRTWLFAGLAWGLLPAVALAGPYVDWFDDGTVLLKLGPTYDDAVIQTDADSLGSLFSGPDAKPFEGQTITILAHDEGVKGPMSGPLLAFAPVFEELSGATVEMELVPISDLYATMMLDFEQGTNKYDAIVVPAYFYGDLIAGERIVPVGELMASGRFPTWSYESMPAALRNLYSWEGTGYGVLSDADGQVLYYRRDVLNDPDWQAQFEAEVGHPLPVPPTTWQQLLEIAQFFDGKNWDSNDANPDDAIVLHLKTGEQGHYHFQSLAASFAIAPGDGVDQYRNVFWFDPTDMTPLIDSPGHVGALEFLQELHELGPIEQIGWRLPDAWAYFLRGKALMMFTWGDLGALCQDTTVSLVKGSCGVAPLPTSDRYYDREAGTWVEADQPRLVGNTTGGSWHGVVAAQSDAQEAAYAFLSLMAIEPVSMWNVTHGWTGIDPGFSFQFPPPDGTASLAEYVKAGWNRVDATEYLTAFHATFTAPTMLDYLRIQGTPEYWSVLDREVAAALGGRKTAEAALTATAEAWEGITDRLGREQQLQAYRAAIGYQNPM